MRTIKQRKMKDDSKIWKEISHSKNLYGIIKDRTDKAILRGKKQSKRHNSLSQTSDITKATVKKTVWYWYKNRTFGSVESNRVQK